MNLPALNILIEIIVLGFLLLFIFFSLVVVLRMKIPNNFEKRVFEVLTPSQVGYSEKGFCLGVDSNNSHTFTPISTIPEEAKGFFFYLGASGAELLQLFLQSGYNKTCETLFLGYSNDSITVPCKVSDKVVNIYDYSELIRLASKKQYPHLKKLYLGEFELFFNAEPFYGYCGDITELLNRVPHLEELRIWGESLIREKLYLPKLKSLTLYFEEYMVELQNPNAFKQTLDSIFQSDLPALEELSVYYGVENHPVHFHFPQPFLQGVSMPQLKRFEFEGDNFENGDNLLFNINELQQSPLVQQDDFKLLL